MGLVTHPPAVNATFGGVPTNDATKGLPKQVESICPDPGYSKDLYWSDTALGNIDPTIHPDFLDILRAARDLGFSHQQVASNGIKLADPEFAERAAEAGLHTVYLQFDGLDDRVYLQTRGRELLDTKLKAVESIRRSGMRIVHVPTIVGGINEDQVGKILQFAIDNIDVSTGIGYQPVALTGWIIPFCAYNGGFTHRTAIEAAHSVSMDEYQRQRAGTSTVH